MVLRIRARHRWQLAADYPFDDIAVKRMFNYSGGVM